MPLVKNPNLSKNAVDFINDDYLESLVAAGPSDAAAVREVIAKSLEKKPLSVEETAILLRADKELSEEIFDAARQLKQRVYGNRIVLFAPLYIGSYCVNNCKYCAFKLSNLSAIRRTLGDDEIKAQIVALENMGHKRLIMVYGEHPWYDGKYIAHTVELAYSVKVGHGSIRRVNINAAPMDHENFRIIKAAGIGTYQIFQETYHHKTYAEMHPANTNKGDFMWRLDGLSRAFESGIDDMGIGALIGLADWKFDTLGLVSHALYLQQRYGVGPHTISFPRIQPASGVNLDKSKFVNDYDFKKLVAILRLAVPYTGLILTARENAAVRRELMSFGVSQIDAGSRIEMGGYTEAGDAQQIEREQFQLGDIRSLDEVVRQLAQDGYIPSWCTACYRLGRTGEHFMEFAVPGFIKRYCTPNALSTFVEYLTDYASPETKQVGFKLVQEELEKMEDSPMKKELAERIHRIETTDDRDLYF